MSVETQTITLEKMLPLIAKDFVEKRITQDLFLQNMNAVCSQYFKIWDIPQSCYKYQNAENQISAESSEKYIIEKAELNKDNIYLYVKDATFPLKGFVKADVLFKANMIKSLFIESIRVVSKWYLLPFILLIDKKQLLFAFNRIGFRMVSDKLLLDKHLTSFSQEFLKIIATFLKEIGFDELNSQRFAEIFTFLIDQDNAYRLRLEDLFSATSKENLIKNPYKEIKRLSRIMVERDTCPPVAQKFGNVANLVALSLLIPLYKKAFVKSIEKSDFKKLQLDEIDTYWTSIRGDFYFNNLSLEDRLEYAKIKGWNFPQKMMSEKWMIETPFYNKKSDIYWKLETPFYKKIEKPKLELPFYRDSRNLYLESEFPFIKIIN
jgi:hypothetical protein